jgi:predicted nucleic acid-binding protein
MKSPAGVDEIARWGRRAAVIVPIDQNISSMARTLNEAGITPLDAAHVACAEASRCDRLLTCDDRLLRIARAQQLAVVVQNPLEYLEECGHV